MTLPDHAVASPTPALSAQLEARQRASEEDARALEALRVAAAQRALANLGAADDELMADELPAADEPPPAVPVPTGGPATAVGQALAAATAGRPRDGRPLLEVKPTVFGAELDRLTVHLEVHPDRLELRDRHGGLLRTMAMAAVTEVEVQRRLSGATLVVRSHLGVDLVVRGLRADTADETRRVILEQRPPAGSPVPVDEAAVLRTLADLHRLGVLDDGELAAKQELVARLARAADAR